MAGFAPFAMLSVNAALQSDIDIKERVQALNDTQFEQLIVKLMLGLGYGEGGSGKRTGGNGDGAIDGVITEDVLGLNKIYLQAKRYSPDSAIGPDKIREFAGAMDAHGILGSTDIEKNGNQRQAYSRVKHMRASAKPHRNPSPVL